MTDRGSADKGSAKRGFVTTIAAAMVGSVIATAPGFAENVPLPTPAPQPKAGASAPQPAPPAAADQGTQRKGFFPFSFSLDKGITLDKDKDKGASQPATAFDAKQRAILTKVSAYLSSVQTMVGNFVQVAPDGGRAQGTFYIQKPGKVRFEYNPPSPIDIVADGSSVVVRDRKLATQDLYPLSQTPLRYLLADHIDLMRDTDVVSVSSDESFVTVVIEEKQLVVGTNRLMIMFDGKDLQLKQWTVTDPQGYDTTVAVYNLDQSKKPDPNMFVINYQRNIQ